jgi:magnesium-protoporphyrin O-methyltransferase
MPSFQATMATSYQLRRGQIETYFDRTAADAWKKLTSDAPLGRIRATVRAGRDEMRRTLLSWLPQDMTGLRLLDAGCGTGVLTVEAARRGAHVVAIDLSPTLVQHARENLPSDLGSGRVEFLSGDMLADNLGVFDHVVAMDSLIHYRATDSVAALARIARRTSRSILFTFAPLTPPLAVMITVGRLFPRGDRSPAIEPVGEKRLAGLLARDSALIDWRQGQTKRIESGFYKSQAVELLRI